MTTITVKHVRCPECRLSFAPWQWLACRAAGFCSEGCWAEARKREEERKKKEEEQRLSAATQEPGTMELF